MMNLEPGGDMISQKSEDNMGQWRQMKEMGLFQNLRALFVTRWSNDDD